MHKHANDNKPGISGDVLGALLINLAGRQRMLSQRIVLQTVFSSLGAPAALDAAKETLTLFASTQL